MFEADAAALQERRRLTARKTIVPVSSAIVFILMVSLLYGLIIAFAFGWLSSDSDSTSNAAKESRTVLDEDLNELRLRKNNAEHAHAIAEPSEIECLTTKGNLVIKLSPESAPNGVAELTRMVRANFFEDVAFFRVNDHITQFGVREKTSPYKSKWERDLNHPDKSQRKPWKRGTVAMIGGTQMVIVKKDSRVMGLNNHDTIVGRISEEDMATVIDRLYRYNDIIDHPHGGPGPDQSEIYRHGWKYLNEKFPLVDKIIRCEMRP